MKRLFITLFFISTVLFCIANKMNPSPYQTACDTSSILQFQIENIPSENIDIGSITLLVNSMNNIITTYGILMSLIALIIAIAGLIAYKTIYKTIDNKVKDLEKIKISLETELGEILSLKEEMIKQGLYTGEAIEYIYDALSKVANKLKDRQLLIDISSSMQVVNLYSPLASKRFASLAYLEHRGTEKDIIHLKNITESSIVPNKDKIWAAKIIGKIEK